MENKEYAMLIEFLDIMNKNLYELNEMMFKLLEQKAGYNKADESLMSGSQLWHEQRKEILGKYDFKLEE